MGRMRPLQNNSSAGDIGTSHSDNLALNSNVDPDKFLFSIMDETNHALCFQQFGI